MKIILMERVEKLGQIGDEVTVKDGYARNFLLPQQKAIRASKANRQRFESGRVQLETQNLERRGEAGTRALRTARDDTRIAGVQACPPPTSERRPARRSPAV